MKTRMQKQQGIYKDVVNTLEKRGKSAVLSQHVLENWERITGIVKERMHIAMEDIVIVGNTKDPESFLPSVLSNLTPSPCTSEYAEKNPSYADTQQGTLDNCKMHLLKLEEKLYDLGLRSEMLEYFESGEEALVFKVKGIDDLLLKVSVKHELGESLYLNESFANIIIGRVHGDELQHQPISVSLSPKLHYSDSETSLNLDSEVLNKINIMHDDLIVDDTMLNNLLKLECKKYKDVRFNNTSHIEGLANYPLIIDRRAVDPLPSSTISNNSLSQQQIDDIEDVYKTIRKSVTSHLENKYGKGLEAMKNVFRESREFCGLESNDKPVMQGVIIP